MMTEMIRCKNKIDRIKNINLEIDLLVQNSRRFYNLCLEKSNSDKNILSLFEARTYFESCLTIIKSMIEPNENELISKVNLQQQDFRMAIDILFENFMSVLDVETKELKKYIDDSKVNISNEFIVKVCVKSFREKIMDYMENLVLFPLTNTLRIYDELERKGKIKETTYSEGEGKDIKEINLTKRKYFEYILFTEVFKSAKIKGSQTRQKITASQGSLSNFHETNIIKPGRNKQEVFSIPRDSPPEPMAEFEDIPYEEP